MGLWVLLGGPSKWLSEYARVTDMEMSQESILGKSIILLYLIFSFILSFYIHGVLNKSANKLTKVAFRSILTAMLLTSVYIFSFYPQWLISYAGGVSEKIETISFDGNSNQLSFVYGPYPNEEMIKTLKDKGYDGIISLLHEYVVPAEPNLIKQEAEFGKKYGIEIINMPMLPWISGNKQTIENVKDFIETKKGVYYVHCYFGRDRVNIFKSIVNKYGKQDELKTVEKVDKSSWVWERGDYFKLEAGVYMTPYPTDDEFIKYVLGGYFKTVISTLNDKEENNIEWIAKETEIFSIYPVKYIHYPLDGSINQKGLDQFKELINTNKKPILIHDFLTKSPLSKFIINNYDVEY